ncbi:MULTISPECIES: primosomal protein N' [Bradyrhizobium]|jgi:primosomal protein N' (replication factor Y) (superfamily II helicase)|uniref:primosomal protein N' n=1 Tax=Bradyrhizobium TaxID=374 RepID=UPI000489E413|nr:MULTISPECIES: primosomal protein N' [Bradyrhizobium]MCS3444732.1 primosomal protein N' (replication factor Y) [Bradyrhizobium elkanii]MCS3564140.1 primosomal protein N' (replication factor Y) [Bradyrhizobium elkanii]MCW2146028.1 primosomal protein N' (replication factor Y) [Bradyrhizobium elkanii]MCW2354899.1 primosomal protein N' (replication factor Y) [Bradyrhizobium elkanii]MCW2378855.1 primosomal protein N' (replication factor Y) [Bradyrhizobium elkanii]
MDHTTRSGPSSASTTRVVDVLVPVALNQTYSYRVPRGMELVPGDVIGVPLGPREVVAVVWAENANPDPRLHNRLKDVSEKLDVPPLKPELRQLVDWVSNYTLSARGMVLRMTLRMGDNLGPERTRLGVRLVGEPPRRLTPARRRAIEVLSDRLLHGKSEAAREAGVSSGVIDGLVDEGTLTVEAMPPPAPPPVPDPSYAQPDFSREQRSAVDVMRALAASGSFHVALLDGVTGSGKTEVYFEAIAENIRRGKQTLILMPEIALTGQFLDRFAQRFGVRPLEWHSELTPRTRARNWAAIAEGKAPVVVGARSALFLPYADLGLIIVDEEHDQAYKQDDGAHYHARDMAVVRAHIAKIPIVLASATPSVESEVNARKGRYQRVALPSRFGGQHMPHIEAIDMRRAPPPRGRFISPVLAEQIRHAIERREQALLFLNRRGYAPLTLCRACGHRFACTICDAWLVDHRFRQRLVCHHCGFSMPRPNICPHCAAEESLVAVGPGVERLQEEAAHIFPEARTMVLSSDLITSIETMRSELNEIAEGRVDIIIGTQLVAKGHNFPRLNLVGVIDADLGLSNGDPRAAERTFQLLNQVVGRAGREQGRGVGFLQTHQPEHPVIKALIANDREAFYASEIEIRERTGYPPFGRLASLIVSAGDRPTAEGFARKLAAVAPLDERIQVLGPAEAPLAVIKGRYRFRLLVKSLRNVDLSQYLREWLAAGPKTKGNLKLEVDVDPQSFL